MKRFFSLGSLLAVLAFAVVLATVPGCPESKVTPTKDKAAVATDKSATPKDDTTPKGGKGEAVVAKAYDAVVKGKVVYDGTPPEMPPIKAMAGHGDEAKCHAGPTKEQTWIVGKDNGVANVAVYLEPAGGKFFAIDEKVAKEHKNSPSIDQPFCVYEPGLVGIFTAYKSSDGEVHDVGAELVVKNSGVISHNTKIQGGRANPLQDHTLNAGEKKMAPIKYQKEVIDVACSKHQWMNAKIKAFDHPFFAVTDKDGNFEIKNVPSDVDLVVKLWHVDGTGSDVAKKLSKGDNAVDLKIKKS